MLLPSRRRSKDRGKSSRLNQNLHLHFVGIGGIGMSGLAEVFHNQGYRVSGSDIQAGATTQRLKAAGVEIRIGHVPENIENASVVVISSAISESNPEVQEARKRRIPVIPRAEMLGELMRGKTGVAVAGTHGKTTTTSMLAVIVSHAGLDPTLVIGGRVDSFGGNAKLGKGDYVVAEADESDGSFLHLPATYGVITNIDEDHLDFFENLKAIDRAFVNFVGKLPFYGVAAVCGDDPGVRRCIAKFQKPYVTYGLSENLDYRGVDVRPTQKGYLFQVTKKGSKFHSFEIVVPGNHNVINALGAIAIADHLGIAPKKIAEGLKKYTGVDRRFQFVYRDTKNRRCIVDDYAHHPTEITATLSAARSLWKGRIVSVFQPHRFSRTLHAKAGFLSSFRQSDVVLITDIYPASEEPIEGVTAENLVREMRKVALEGQEIYYVGDLANSKKMIKKFFSQGDMLLVLGAGSITRLAKELSDEFQKVD